MNLKGGRKTDDDGWDCFSCLETPIISVKEARKILGKEMSDKLSDEDLARVIGQMCKIACSLIDNFSVPNNNMVL